MPEPFRMVGNCFDYFCVYSFYDHSFGVAIKIYHGYDIISIFFA